MANIKDYALDKRYIHLLYSCFYDLHDILINHEISYWASGGSVLSAIRHQGQNPIDDDIDIEISYLNVDKMLTKKFKADLAKKGYYLKLHSETGKKNKRNGLKYDWIKINSRKKVNGHISSIDVFPVKLDYDSTGKLRTFFDSDYSNEIWPNSFHYLSDLLPLKQVKFGKGVIIVPKNSRKYLTRAYGRSWSRTMYITMDKDHYMLDTPIKINTRNFKAAGDFASARYQIRLYKNDILLTMKGSILL
jgi:phosphorylcholine metabolism protein LicD